MRLKINLPTKWEFLSMIGGSYQQDDRLSRMKRIDEPSVAGISSAEVDLSIGR